jgi:protein-S-isoprenylcysteine O-methyltransferase Ste14
VSTTSLERSFAGRLRAFEHTKLYDLLAVIPIIGWYGFCSAQQLPALKEQLAQIGSVPIDVLFLASLASKLSSLLFVAVLAIVLVLRHKPIAKSSRLYPRLAAFEGTYLGVAIVLQPRADLSAFLYLVSTLLILAGTALSLYSVLHLGRSISIMPEARRLVTAGPYAAIRHPLYLSEAFALVGLTLQYFSLGAVLILIVQCAFQLERMKNEERVLSGIFPEYVVYMQRTARLVPGIY